MAKYHLLSSLILFMGSIATGFSQQPAINAVELFSSGVEKNGKLEMRVDIEASYANPYDYDQVWVKGLFTTPAGEELVVDGFFMQAYEEPDVNTGSTIAIGEGEFRIRFSPRSIGSWGVKAVVINSVGSDTSEVYNFECIPEQSSSNKGFIHASPSNYLQFDNAEAFIPLGENMAWALGNPVVNYYQWITKLSNAGGNYFRIWQCHWGLGLEWLGGGYDGLKAYRQINALYTDWLIDYCAEQGVYIQYCLQHHGQVSSEVNPNWSESPYNAANGGMCQNTWDFFTHEQAIAYTKNKFRYVIARWGYARTIAAWELFNEADWTDQYEQHREVVTEWHLEMAQFLKEIDPNQHLVTTSFAKDIYEPSLWSSAEIDFTQTHYYFDTPNLEAIIAQGTQQYLGAYQKPCLNGEFGVSTNGSDLSDMDPDGIHVHNSIWGSFYGGGLGAGMPWWWDVYMEPEDLYYHFTSLSQLIASVDWLGGNFRPTEATLSGASADLIITPDQGWGVPTDDSVFIDEEGHVTAELGLGVYLYGSAWNTQYRNPPTFFIETDVPRTFTLRTGGMTGQGPVISITLDGQEVLSQNGQTNQEYSISIPAGNHEILVDNTGTDWIAISAYIISGLGTAVDAYVLVNEQGTAASGWLLNKAYNHQNAEAGSLPAAAAGVEARIEGMTDGTFYVRYYDCLNGAFVDDGTVDVVNGVALLRPPEIVWDLSFIINSDIADTREEDVVQVQEARVYPNPVSGTNARLSLDLPQKSKVQVSLLNAAAKHITSLVDTELPPGKSEIPLSFSPGLATGWYWIVLQTGQHSKNLPIVITRS
jgi:hypothetical protein